MALSVAPAKDANAVQEDLDEAPSSLQDVEYMQNECRLLRSFLDLLDEAHTWVGRSSSSLAVRMSVEYLVDIQHLRRSQTAALRTVQRMKCG